MRVLALSLAIALVPGLCLARTHAASPYEDTSTAFEAGVKAYGDGNTNEASKRFDEAAAAAAGIEDEALRLDVLAAIAENRALVRIADHEKTGAIHHLQRAEGELAAFIDGASEPPGRIIKLRDDIALRIAAAQAGSSDPPQEVSGGRSKATIAGIVVASSSAIGLAVMIAGLALGPGAEDDFNAGPSRADRDAADRRGARANSMAFGGGLSAAITLSVGAALLVIGKRSDVAQKKTSHRVRWGPGGARIRFAP